MSRFWSQRTIGLANSPGALVSREREASERTREQEQRRRLGDGCVVSQRGNYAADPAERGVADGEYGSKVGGVDELLDVAARPRPTEEIPARHADANTLLSDRDAVDAGLTCQN